MNLKQALQRVELIRELADTPLQEVAANELEQFIKEQGKHIHEAENQLMQQLEWYLENKRLKKLIKTHTDVIDKMLENF